MADVADRAADAVTAAAGRAQDAAQSGSEYARHIAATGADKAKSAVKGAKEAVAQVGSDRAAEWVDQAADAVKELASLVDETVARARQQTNSLASEVARRADEQPLMALLVAGAVGYALAYLFHGRR